jgi:hypothetical protein
MSNKEWAAPSSARNFLSVDK